MYKVLLSKSEKEHECTYLRASEVAGLMQTANWECHSEKWDSQRRKTYVYVTKTKVTYVVTKYSPYYSKSDMFKTKTDYLYVDCFEDYNVFHMQGGHQG